MPIEPPTRFSTFSCGVAWLTWLRSSAANAAVIAGMKLAPMPAPRRTITTHSKATLVWAPISANGTVITAVTMTPTSATGPPP